MIDTLFLTLAALTAVGIIGFLVVISILTNWDKEK